MVQDKLQNMHARGDIQLGTFTSVHPGGAVEAVKVMEQDRSATRDQSQQQLAQGKEELKERAKESAAHAEQVRDERKKG